MKTAALREATITRSVIGAFFEVYNTLGFGFVEQLYKTALEHELDARGHRVDREVPVQVSYKERIIGTYRIDMVIDQKLIIEAKSTLALSPSAPRQLYNYLHASKLKVGLLLHFGPKPRFYRQICD